MSSWQFAEDATENERTAFADLDQVFALEGTPIARDPLSQVIRVEIAGQGYYVKRYWGAGKGLRRWLGRPRVKAEWQNLKLFKKWGIPTAELVGWGLERKELGRFGRGALITRELPNTADLAAMSNTGDPRLRDRSWVELVSQQLATITRTLHDRHFAHNDLKWRNLLVDQQRRLFLIDCPTGAFWRGPLLRYRIVKDLACLDKVAKLQLSNTQRLRFYLQYRGTRKLDASDKRHVRQVLKFFEGRE